MSTFGFVVANNYDAKKDNNAVKVALEKTASRNIPAWMEANNLTKLKNQEAYIVEPVYEVSEDYEVISTAPIEIIANVLEE